MFASSEVRLPSDRVQLDSIIGLGGTASKAHQNVSLGQMADSAFTKHLIQHSNKNIDRITLFGSLRPGYDINTWVTHSDAHGVQTPIDVLELSLYNTDVKNLTNHVRFANTEALEFNNCGIGRGSSASIRDFLGQLIASKVKSNGTTLKELMIVNHIWDEDWMEPTSEATKQDSALLDELSGTLTGLEILCIIQKREWMASFGKAVSRWGTTLKMLSIYNGYGMSLETIAFISQQVYGLVGFGYQDKEAISLLMKDIGYGKVTKASIRKHAEKLGVSILPISCRMSEISLLMILT